MKHYEIRGELIKKGTNCHQFSKEQGVSDHMVRLVIQRKSTSRRIAQAIADKIGKPLEVVFPEYKDKQANAQT